MVIEKLESSIYAKSFPTRGDLVKFASALSDVKLLKQTYLTTSWTETLKAAAKVVPKDDAEDGEENLESLVKHETDQLPTKIPVKLILVDQDRENKVKSSTWKILFCYQKYRYTAICFAHPIANRYDATIGHGTLICVFTYFLVSRCFGDRTLVNRVE